MAENKEKTTGSRSRSLRVKNLIPARKAGSGSPGKRSLVKSSRDRSPLWKSFGQCSSRRTIKGRIFRESLPSVSGEKTNMGNSAKKMQTRKRHSNGQDGNVADDERANANVLAKKTACSAKKKSLVKGRVIVHSATDERCAKRRKEENPSKSVKGQSPCTVARYQPAINKPSYLHMAYAAFPRKQGVKKKGDCITSAADVGNVSEIQKDGKLLNTARKQQMTYIPAYLRLDNGARNIRPVIKRRSLSLPAGESNEHMSEMPVNQSTDYPAINIRHTQNRRCESLSTSSTVTNRSKSARNKDRTTSARDWHSSSMQVDHPSPCIRRVKKKKQDETFSRVPKNLNNLSTVQKGILSKKADDWYCEQFPNDQCRTCRGTNDCETSRRNVKSSIMKDNCCIIDPQEDLYMSKPAKNAQQPRRRKYSRPTKITTEHQTANAWLTPHMSTPSSFIPPTSRWKFQNTLCMTKPTLEGSLERQQSEDFSMGPTAAGPQHRKRRRSSTVKSSSHSSTTPAATQTVQRWKFHKDFWNTTSTTEESQQSNQSPGQKTSKNQLVAGTPSGLCDSDTPPNAPVQRWKFKKDFWEPTANQEESRKQQPSPVRRIKKGKNREAGDRRMLKRVKIQLLTQRPSQDSSIGCQHSPSNGVQFRGNSKGKHRARPYSRNKGCQYNAESC